MNVFRNFFSDGRAESVVLVDVRMDSVAGAYLYSKKGEVPSLIYTERIPISARTDESAESATLRALETLGASLVREGAPALLRATGSGRSNAVLVSIDGMWQKTSVRTERFERKDPFLLTKQMVTEALAKSAELPPGYLLADESIIDSMLNGYGARNPYGKKARRADLIILTSFIAENIAKSVSSLFRGLYHTDAVLCMSGNSLRYQAMRSAFPHERDAIIIDALGSSTSITMIRNGLFVVLAEMSETLPKGTEWVQKIAGELTALKERYPLPRTIFLLVQESETASLQKLLEAANLNTLWFSDNPPKIIPVLPSHVVGLVRQAVSAPPDLQLLFMALFRHYRVFAEGEQYTDHSRLV